MTGRPRYDLPEPEDYAAIRAAMAPALYASIRAKVLEAHERGKIADVDVDAIEATIMSRLELGLRRATMESWTAIRRRVYQRDHGFCHVCGFGVVADGYECGHIVDRCMGGSDRDSNLVVMHDDCNRLKPFHATREEYTEWLRTGLPAQMWAEALRMTGVA